MLGTMARNWWTTTVGIAVAVASYLEGVGPNPPATRAEWARLLLSLGLAILGVVAKDATTGSRPS